MLHLKGISITERVGNSEVILFSKEVSTVAEKNEGNDQATVLCLWWGGRGGGGGGGGGEWMVYTILH